MKEVILVISNTTGGLALFRQELLSTLIKSYEIHVIASDTGRLENLMEIGCKVHIISIDRRGKDPVKDSILIFTYFKFIKKLKPKLVITYTIKPNIYGGIAARLAKKQYAVNITGLGTAFEKSGKIRTLVVNLYKFALKKARVVFFENSSNRDEILSFGCCDKEKTVVLNGAGVNTRIYSYQPYPNNDNVKFLFVGRVMKEKGIDELFEAMKKLVGEGEKCFLDVVGPFEEDYKDKLEQYEKAGWLKYHGYQKNVIPFIAACDCFVLPSYHEGMANTNLECASCGRPIITSNIPGCKEAVVEDSGLLCEPRNAESLYEAMKAMIEKTREERERMGKVGRKHMEDVFDKKKVVEETVKHLF